MPKPAKTVGIKDLKNNLSRYLNEVRLGARVYVTDRERIVAEIHEPGAEMSLINKLHPVLQNWIETGAIIQAASPKSKMTHSHVHLKQGTAIELLGLGRAE